VSDPPLAKGLQASRQWLIGARGDPRVAGWQAALAAAGLPVAKLIDYRDALANDALIDSATAQAGWLRIESPGRDFEVYRALLVHGYADAVESGQVAIDPDEVATLVDDRGRILYPAQHQAGFRRLMASIALRLRDAAAVTPISHPDDITTLFDKSRCHAVLRRAGVPVPPALSGAETIHDYDGLRAAMAAQRLPRVFVKLRYGSSGSGVVAYQISAGRELAITTVEMVRDRHGRVRLYNSRRLRRYQRREQLRALFDTLCPHGVQVEAWFPKAGIGDQRCDLRVLTIAGQPRHRLLRRSRSPLTNLHLGNRRSTVEPLRARMSAAAWDALLASCRRVAARFPRCLHLGIDIAVGVNLRDHVVLEVNAFGDHLVGALDAGQNPWQAEVAALAARPVRQELVEA
jgi:glutathione synthase/RimK-type ligase-like ATP-grasp enzyme